MSARKLEKDKLLIKCSFFDYFWIINPERKQYTKRKNLKTDIVIECIKTTIQTNPFMSIRKLVCIINKSLNVQISRELVRVILKKLNFTRKKAKPTFVPKLYPEKVKEFLNMRNMLSEAGKNFVSIDETSFSYNQKDIKGYSTKGTKLYYQKKQLYAKNISVLACASKNGWTHTKQIFGSFNSITFSEFIKELNLREGTVILLDNVAFHKSKIVQEVVKDKGYQLLFVPPYSPWFNPIEMCFSIVKRKYYE